MRANTASIVALVVLACSCAGPRAGTIETRWNAVPGATGYKVHAGNAPGEYPFSKDVGRATSYMFTDAVDCMLYYVAVSAYDADGDGPLSAEVAGYTAPTIARVDGGVDPEGNGPPYQPGVDYTGVTVSGSGFPPGVVVEVEGATVRAIRRLACDRLEIDLTFGPGPRKRDVKVISESGSRVGTVATDAVTTRP